MSPRWRINFRDLLQVKPENYDRFMCLAAGVASVLGVLVVFIPVLVYDYGIYDALRMALDFAWTGESRLIGVMMGGGRFVYAWIAQAGFSLTQTIGDLWMLRLFSVLSLSGCSLIITLYARRQGWPYLAAVCIGIVAVVNPGTAVYGFWSACFPYGLGILSAFLAGILWAESSWKQRTVAVLLMQAALQIYQPAALFMFLGPFLQWSGDRGRENRPYAAVWCALGILLNLLLHLVLVRLTLVLNPDIPSQSERLLAGGFLEAIGTAILVVVPRVFAGWGDLLPHGFALGIFLVHAIGWILFLAGPENRILKAFSLVPLSLTLLPAIVSAGGYAPYRLLAPAYCACGAVALAGFSGGITGRHVLRFLSVTGFGVILLVAGAYVIQFGIVRPRTIELSVIRQSMLEYNKEQPLKGLVIIRPEGTYPFDVHIPQKAEYGAFELSYGGFSEAYLSLVAAELFGWRPGEINPLNRIHWVLCPSSTETVPPFYPVLDLRVRLQGKEVPRPVATHGTAVRHPYLGDALYCPPDLYLSPNLGLTQQQADRWFFKPGSGWMQWISEPGSLPLEARDTEGTVIQFPHP